MGAAFHRLVIFISLSLSLSCRCLFVDCHLTNLCHLVIDCRLVINCCLIIVVLLSLSSSLLSSLSLSSSLSSCCHRRLVILVLLSSSCYHLAFFFSSDIHCRPRISRRHHRCTSTPPPHQADCNFLHSPPPLPLLMFFIGGCHRMIRAFGVNPRHPQLSLASHHIPRCHCRHRHPLPSTTISSTSFCNLHFSAG